MEDNDFHGFRKSLDKKMKNLTSIGHRTAPRQAEIITEQTVQELWEKIFLDGMNQKNIKNSLFLSW